MSGTGAVAGARTGVLPRSLVGTYAVGSLGTGGFNTLPGLVLLYFLTDVLGVGALIAGVVLAVCKIWDVVIDPVIGPLSDRSLARTGSRRRLLVIGAVTIPVTFTASFTVPGTFGPGESALWVAVAFMAAATSFSLFQVPYLALAAEVTDSYDERTRLLTWRIVVLTVAILLFGGAFPALRNLADNPRTGYLLLGAVSGVLIGVAFFVASRSAPRGAPFSGAAQTPARLAIVDGYRDAWAAFRSSTHFRALWWSFAVKSVATGLLLAVAQYVATWVLHSESAVTLLFLALIAPALLLTPAWGLLARRIGKEGALYVASFLFAAATLSLVALLWWPGTWLYVPVIVAGASYAGLQSLPLSILPDVVGYETKRQGSQRAGTFTGVWTAGETTGLALGALLLSVVLTSTGYVESTAAETVVQPSAAIDGIILSLSVIPSALVLTSTWIFTRYRLRRSDIDALAASAPIPR